MRFASCLCFVLFSVLLAWPQQTYNPGTGTASPFTVQPVSSSQAIGTSEIILGTTGASTLVLTLPQCCGTIRAKFASRQG
jgi:hypothetical protein